MANSDNRFSARRRTRRPSRTVAADYGRLLLTVQQYKKLRKRLDTPVKHGIIELYGKQWMRNNIYVLTKDGEIVHHEAYN